MKITFYEIEGWEEKIIRKEFSKEEVALSPEPVSSLHLPKDRESGIISIFVNSRIDAEVLNALPNVRCIAARSTGYDHIDLAECKKRGIAVVYVPGYGDNTVAEFAFGLLLNLTRKMYKAVDQIKETGSFSLAGLRGMDLKGKTMGILGTGRIGREMAKISRGFGMNLLGFDPYPDQKFAQEIGLKYCAPEEMLASSDVISIHCPYTPETHHFLNMKNIGLIKKGAYLINTARGGILETEALVYALQNGILAGAGLDVLEEEGDMKDELNLFCAEGHPNAEELKVILANHVLMKMPNVLITPHNAFNTEEALARILGTTIQNISGFLKGKPENAIS